MVAFRDPEEERGGVVVVCYIGQGNGSDPLLALSTTRDESEPAGGAFIKNTPTIKWRKMHQGRQSELPTLYRPWMN
jgi:hypothetical protein